MAQTGTRETVIIETHEAVKGLMKHDLTETQADGIVKFHVTMIEKHFATKSDLREMETRMKTRTDALGARMDTLEVRMDARMDALGVRMDTLDDRMDALNDQMKIRMDALNDRMEARMDAQDDRMDIKLAETNIKLADIRTEIARGNANSIKWMAMFMAAVGTMMVAALKYLP